MYLNCMHVTLMNDKMQFSKKDKMLPNLPHVLIYSLTKCVIEDVLKTAVLKTLQKNIRDGGYC